MAAGESPLAADAVAVEAVDAARAGEKAGANTTMAASIMAQMRRIELLFFNTLDAQRSGAGLRLNNDGNMNNGFGMFLDST